jgi:hypothetical protein
MEILMKKIVTLVLTGMILASSAQAVELNVVGGLTMASPSANSTGVVYTSSSALTFGALLDFGFIPGFAIETGLLSVGEKFKETTLGIDTNVKTRAWEVPVLLEFTALPLLNVGAGVYFQKYNGTFDTDTNGVTTTGNSWTGANLKQNDFGAKINARLMLPIAPLTHFLVDASYKLGLSNLSTTSGSSFKTREFAALVGVGFGF